MINEMNVIDGKRVWIYHGQSIAGNNVRLENQRNEMMEFANNHGFEVIGCTTEIASGKKIRCGESVKLKVCSVRIRQIYL